MGGGHLLTSFAFVKALADDPDSHLNPTRFIYPISASLWLVLNDVEAKPMRSLLALPVTANSLWSSFWWLTFGLPAIASTFISLVALAGAWLFGPLAIPLDKVLIWLIEQWGALALGWCCLSLSGDDIYKRRPISSTIARAFPGLQIALFLVFDIPISFLWQSVILGVSGSTIATALFGKKITGQFILERIGRPDYFIKSVSYRRPSDKTISPVGWMVLAPLIARRMVGVMCLWAFMGWINGKLSSSMNPEASNASHASDHLSNWSVFLICSAWPLSWTFVNAIQAFRQLPMSRSFLSIFFLLLACLPYFLVILACAVVLMIFQVDISGLWSRKSDFSLLALAFSAYIPAILFNSRSDVWRMLGLIIFVALPIITVVVVIEIAISGTIPRLFLATLIGTAAFYWTRWEISSGRTAYQSPVTNTNPIST